MANSLARKLALASLGISVVSWADYEVRKKKRLTPLPLTVQYKDIQRAILPPFLPEEMPPVELDPHLNNLKGETEDVAQILSDIEEKVAQTEEEMGPEITTAYSTFNVEVIRRNMKEFLKSASNPEMSILRNWRMMKRLREREDLSMKREKIMNELLVLQKLKAKTREKITKRRFYDHTPPMSKPQDMPLGYALVTGASRGIGRAIAIELARYEIPLILVARDFDKLKKLADEVESFYGVNCCILPADLSQPGTADQVHEAVKDAGLRVDILVNNAGVCARGDLLENSRNDLENMLDVNVRSVTSLSYLFGKSMKAQRRGRILFVSSVAGAVPGCPGVAGYAASKAYEKSLASSLEKELEPYGVGVTCVMPGAVKGTTFSARGKLEEALCWKIPFYAMNAPKVASTSIRGLLSGDAEITPGWHNRSFLKLVVPVIPQRLTTFIAGTAFSPVEMPRLPWTKQRDEIIPSVMNEGIMDSDVKIRSNNAKPPQLLTLPKIEEKKPPNVSTIDEEISSNSVSEEEVAIVEDDPAVEETVQSNVESNDTIIDENK